MWLIGVDQLIDQASEVLIEPFLEGVGCLVVVNVADEDPNAGLFGCLTSNLVFTGSPYNDTLISLRLFSISNTSFERSSYGSSARFIADLMYFNLELDSSIIFLHACKSAFNFATCFWKATFDALSSAGITVLSSAITLNETGLNKAVNSSSLNKPNSTV